MLSAKNRKGKLDPPQASLEEPAALWEVLGLDVFEFENVVEDVAMKSKFLIMVDRGSRFTMVSLLKTYKAEESWEPSTMDIKRVIVRTWLGASPSPKWFFTDSAAYFTSREMVEFASHSGVGLLVAPAEAHWLLGVEEHTIQVLKRTVEKLERKELDLSVDTMFTLAAHARNSRVNHATGYSPFQWACGWSREASLPIGLDPKRAFGRTLLLQAKAEESYAKADSAIKLSKLRNTVAKASSTYRPGSLAMLWRGPTPSSPSRRKHRLVGHWGHSCQRQCTEREQLVVTAQGAQVHQMAVGLDILLRGYRGKHFVDASGETRATSSRRALNRQIF